MSLPNVLLPFHIFRNHEQYFFEMAAAAIDYSVTAALSNADESQDLVSSVLGELAWFAAGFAVVQTLIFFRILPQMNFPLLSIESRSEGRALQRKCAVKDLCAAASAGQHAKVLEAWDHEKSQGPLPLDALKDSAHALALLAPNRLASDLAAHLARFPAAHTQAAAATMLTALLEVAAEVGGRDLADELASALKPHLGTKPAVADGAVLSGHVGAVKDHLKKGHLDAATSRLAAMRDAEIEPPARAMAEFFEIAVGLGADAVGHLLNGMDGLFVLPPEAMAVVLSDCLAREDVVLARRADALARDQGTQLGFSMYDALLKIYATASDARAMKLFEDMQSRGFFASEGLCGNLLSRCGDAGNLDFAECIVTYLRGRSGMTLRIFKTLMRVYARCGKFDLACDLYEQVLEAGLEPDDVMHGCIIKFAVKCGRPQLAEQLCGRGGGGNAHASDGHGRGLAAAAVLTKRRGR